MNAFDCKECGCECLEPQDHSVGCVTGLKSLIAALTRELEAARAEGDAALSQLGDLKLERALIQERLTDAKVLTSQVLPALRISMLTADRDAARAEVAKLREEVKAAFLRGARLQGADEADAERSWQKYGERDLQDSGESVDKLVRSTYHEAPPCPELTPDQETEIARRAEIEDKDGPSTYSGLSEWYGHR